RPTWSARLLRLIAGPSPVWRMFAPLLMQVPTDKPIFREPRVLQFFEHLPSCAGRESPAMRNDHEEATTRVNPALVVQRILRLHRADLTGNQQQLQICPKLLGAVHEMM